MGMYEPLQHISKWGNSFRVGNSPNGAVSLSAKVDRSHDDDDDDKLCTSQTDIVVFDTNAKVNSKYSGMEETDLIRHCSQSKKRLAQNREAARKSRMRKKAYVRELEDSRLKLSRLEEEVEKARKQGLLIGRSVGNAHHGSANTCSGITAFEIKYANWVEEQHRQVSEIRRALQVHVTDIELRILVDNAINHYNNLFDMKAEAAKTDVFYVMSGTWRTSAERFFLWIGGFSPSQILNVLVPHLDPLTERQLGDIDELRKTFRDSENALTREFDGLHRSLIERVTTVPLDADSPLDPRMNEAFRDLEALERFVIQADLLRKKMLVEVVAVLTVRQTARAFLALGEYVHRLRALSSLWAARPLDPTK